jgi:hypothetical protein
VIDLNRQVAPTGEIEGPVSLIDGASDTLIQKCESPLDGSYMDRKIRAIKNQHFAVKQS